MGFEVEDPHWFRIRVRTWPHFALSVMSSRPLQLTCDLKICHVILGILSLIVSCVCNYACVVGILYFSLKCFKFLNLLSNIYLRWKTIVSSFKSFHLPSLFFLYLFCIVLLLFPVSLNGQCYVHILNEGLSLFILSKIRAFLTTQLSFLGVRTYCDKYPNIFSWTNAISRRMLRSASSPL